MNRPNVASRTTKLIPIEREGTVSGSARAEVAYFTFPDFEGRGVATMTLAELLAMEGRADPEIALAAQTLTGRNASPRVLEKQGFVRMGTVEHPEDGTVLEWRRAVSRVAAAERAATVPSLSGSTGTGMASPISCSSPAPQKRMS